MINLEFYREKIKDFLDENLRYAHQLEHEFEIKMNYGDNYIDKFINWLLEEHKEPPKKTYKEDFFEKFPEAEIGDICRYSVYKTDRCEDRFIGDCELCWNEPMEE